MKVSTWDAIRARIKPLFAAAGITRCELRLLSDCGGDNFLGFAHGKKRRNLSEAEGDTVVLACTQCHCFIERLPEASMDKIVKNVISKRRIPLASAAHLEDDQSYEHHLIINGQAARLAVIRDHGKELILIGPANPAVAYHPGQRVLLNLHEQSGRYRILSAGHTGDQDEHFALELQALPGQSLTIIIPQPQRAILPPQ